MYRAWNNNKNAVETAQEYQAIPYTILSRYTTNNCHPIPYCFDESVFTLKINGMYNMEIDNRYLCL